MKKFLKNKYLLLIIIIVALGIIYFIINQSIDYYNSFDNNIVTKDDALNVNDVLDNPDNKEKAIETSENIKEYPKEELEFVTEGSDNSNNSSISQKTSNTIYIYVTGEVNNPGVVTLTDGCRIADAINAAGGTTSNADVSKVNLVFLLEDGMKINIPSGETLKKNPDFEYITTGSGDGTNSAEADHYNSSHESNNKLSSSTSHTTSDKKNTSTVNINTATQTELETLPGIGPSTALKIINYRTENGEFSSIEDIKKVSGIGDAKFESIKKYIKV